MTKHLRLLMLALLALVCMGGYSQEVTFDFTDYKGNPWKLPTSGYSKEEATFTNGDYSIKLTPGINKGFMLLSTTGSVGTIQMGKQNAALALPIFNFDVEKIVVVGNAAVGNKSVTQNIFVDNVSVSTETKGSASTNQYLISEKYQKSGNIYVLKVTNSYLTHINKIQIYKKQDSGKTDPEIAFKETEKTVELKEGAIELSTLINNPHTLPVTYTSSNAKVAEVSKGVIYMYKTGKVDITAKFAGNDTYNAAEKTLALTIVDNRADAGIHFEKDSYTADINKEDFDGAVLVNPNKLTVTYSINATDKNVQIDDKTGYVMYPSGTEASYEVTAKFSGNDTYKPATVTYTLNVVDPNYEVKIVTFDATVDKGTSSSTSNIGADKLSKNGITIYGERSLFGNGNNYRFYKAVKGNTAKTTISVDKGNIVKIEFTNNNETSLNKLVFNNGYTYDTETKNSVWVGKSNSISFTTDDATVSATKITVTVKVPVVKDFTLDEKEVNEIEDWENSNVTVKRTFYKDGDWNTLCLPFDVSAEEVKAAFGSDAQLRQVDEANSKDNTVAFTTATAIKAGVPYLIKFDKLAENADQPEEFNHTFEGVTLTKKVEYSVLADFNIIFTGSYSAFTPEDFLKEYNTCNVVASMAAANTLKKVNAGTTIKGLRAVFGLASSVQPQAVKVIIDGTATGIGDLHVDGTTVANGRVYNLNGQCVGTSLEGLKAGVYIQNGKKVIINK